jgi:exopolysaccharide biosynthesis polyprenyl glycosylphosphotransferase
VPRDLFVRMLDLEQKRAERSGRRFVLVLLESGDNATTLASVLWALCGCARETDITGWYREGSIGGIIFTEIGSADGKSVTRALLGKVRNAMSSVLSIEKINEIKVSIHVFPVDWDNQEPEGPRDLFAQNIDAKTSARIGKRSLDILGSSFALLLLSPLLIAIFVLVKLTSKGPVFFRQQRMGRGGNKFTFLKFRSMYLGNDHSIHKDFVKRLISGNANSDGDNGTQVAVYKLTNDPRVTPIGRFLRKTSMDELPQLFNVLTGHMSLVGPRPPIPYEFECYQPWHKRRLRFAKPGITGLWQVSGRSRIKFDDMVRLDLKYARTWSLWLDIKILLKTPWAVFSGDGAY